ncbi:MAG: PH domain-containing protein [Muribaculaceae bacterium]|nr:PH domain-containing protein [Muribaculaceae bacterium]
MKSKVKFSVLSIGLTVFTIGIIAVGIICSWGNPEKVTIGSVILTGILLSGMFYAPISIEATSGGVVIHRILKKKRIVCTDIAKVERCYPSGGGIRLCGSGGFMGYWGYFHDIVIGTYFGFYGDRSQCILLKLKSGKQYVISCEKPDEMLVEIEKNIN